MKNLQREAVNDFQVMSNSWVTICELQNTNKKVIDFDNLGKSENP